MKSILVNNAKQLRQEQNGQPASDKPLLLEKREAPAPRSTSSDTEGPSKTVPALSFKKNKSGMYNPFNILTSLASKEPSGPLKTADAAFDSGAPAPAFNPSAHAMSLGFKKVALSKFKNDLMPFNPSKSQFFRR